jgi:LmbE family N-acetylglucosaminyl deacetylase
MRSLQVQLNFSTQAALLLLFAFLTSTLSAAQQEPRTILAIGAHAADMELSAGALLAHQAKLGDRVVLLHLTLGEGGHPKLPPAIYREQKRREAEAAARDLGAEVIFGP